MRGGGAETTLSPAHLNFSDWPASRVLIEEPRRQREINMNDDVILSALNDIFHDLFGNDELLVTPATSAQDVVGWDSLKHISLIVAVEERFGIRIGTAELERLTNVGDLISTIQSKTLAKDN